MKEVRPRHGRARLWHAETCLLQPNPAAEARMRSAAWTEACKSGNRARHSQRRGHDDHRPDSRPLNRMNTHPSRPVPRGRDGTPRGCGVRVPGARRHRSKPRARQRRACGSSRQPDDSIMQYDCNHSDIGLHRQRAFGSHMCGEKVSGRAQVEASRSRKTYRAVRIRRKKA
jgi:hypothetical protein